MQQPTHKNTLWILMLTTFALLAFQRVAVEVVHQVAHLVEGTSHIHTHPTSKDHVHFSLTFSTHIQPKDTNKIPSSTIKFNQQQFQAVIPAIIKLLAFSIITITTFTKVFNLPGSRFLTCESPPPECLIS